MDQMLIAAFFLVNAFAFTAGYYIGNSERKSRYPRRVIVDQNEHAVNLRDAHDAIYGRDDVEKRARRAF